jgi:hypothetical protein
MTKLIELEQPFQNYLLHENNDILQHVVGTTKVPVDVRLSIYGHAYRARLHEALMTTYSVLHGYLGDEQFETLCYEYIDAHPSHFRSVRWFGDELPNFLNEHYHEYPYLAELAQFEWTMALVFDAADSDVLPLADMQAILPEAWIDMRLAVHPSVHRLSLSWNVVQIWQAVSNDESPEEPQQTEASVDWLLWRNDRVSQFSSLAVDEAWAIDAMINGATFGEICEGLCQWVDEENAGMHAASLLKGWIMAGLITEVITSTSVIPI